MNLRITGVGMTSPRTRAPSNSRAPTARSSVKRDEKMPASPSASATRRFTASMSAGERPGAGGDDDGANANDAAIERAIVEFAVEDGAVLDVGARADADPVHVPAHHAVEPDARVVADTYVPQDQRVVGNEHAGAELGNHALEGADHGGSRR